MQVPEPPTVEQVRRQLRAHPVKAHASYARHGAQFAPSTDRYAQYAPNLACLFFLLPAAPEERREPRAGSTVDLHFTKRGGACVGGESGMVEDVVWREGTRAGVIWVDGLAGMERFSGE